MCTTHNVDNSERRAGALRHESISIGNGCWIGTRATILPGVKIGGGSIIAAGAVITKDVDTNTLVGGVPAKMIRQLDNASLYS